MAGKRAFGWLLATALCGVALVSAQAPSTPAATAGTLVESSNEVRFQMDVQVPAAALAAYLPAGWTPNIAAQGNAKDCNLRVIFIDRVSINGPDGKPLGKGSHRVIWLAAPVKDATGANVQLIVGGLTDDPANVPGPFGNFLLATTHMVQRTTTSGMNGPTIDGQDWAFAAVTGERLELHIKYERGVANKGNVGDTRYYSAKNPTFFQISRQEGMTDVVRNATMNPPDRVKEYSLKGGGGSYAKLFDGTEKSLSWDNILWLNRSVLLP